LFADRDSVPGLRPPEPLPVI